MFPNAHIFPNSLYISFGERVPLSTVRLCLWIILFISGIALQLCDTWWQKVLIKFPPVTEQYFTVLRFPSPK